MKTNVFKEKREKLGLTQQAAANHLHVAIATWCRWESGQIVLPERRRLLKLLDYDSNQSPAPCAAASKLPWNSDDLRKHLQDCEPCQLRLEYLHREMDWN